MNLVLSDINQHYGSSHTLRSVSLAIETGQCLALLGRNGAGKSTLLKCIMGVLQPTSGSITIDGQVITRWLPYERSRAGLAYVPQGREIFSELTVAENITAAARAHGRDKDGSIEEAVSFFPILRDRWHRLGGGLSGGQQQQLAFARALVTRPKIIILDEPTEGIQPSIVKVIEEVMAGLKGKVTFVLVEQYLDFAMSLADAFAVMSRGSIIDQGARADMNRERLSHFISV